MCGTCYNVATCVFALHLEAVCGTWLPPTMSPSSCSQYISPLALEQEAAAVDAEKQANKKRRKEKQRALAEEQAPAAPASAKQAPTNEEDLFGDNEVQACSWTGLGGVLCTPWQPVLKMQAALRCPALGCNAGSGSSLCLQSLDGVYCCAAHGMLSVSRCPVCSYP